MAVAGLAYLPRQDSPNGRIKSYRIETSTDGKTWKTTAAREFPNRAEKHTARFKQPQTIRHLRITAVDSHGGSWATAAEFTLVLNGR